MHPAGGAPSPGQVAWKGRNTLAKDAMRRMGDAFIPGPQRPTETTTETGGTRAARARRRRRIK